MLSSMCVRRHSGQLQSRATSFLATKATDKGRISTFQVHVPLVDVPGNAAGASIRALEQARAENERHMFEQDRCEPMLPLFIHAMLKHCAVQAVNDLRALPGSVVEKLEVELGILVIDIPANMPSLQAHLCHRIWSGSAWGNFECPPASSKNRTRDLAHLRTRCGCQDMRKA